MAPLVSLQLSCISARSSAPHICQTNSSKPKTLTMFLSKVKLHLDDARQYCLHEVRPKAIPFIILLRKVTSGLITWQPLGIIWKHARHWREFFVLFFVSSDRSPYEELPATWGDIDKKALELREMEEPCLLFHCHFSQSENLVGVTASCGALLKRHISRWDKVIVLQDTSFKCWWVTTHVPEVKSKS